MVNSKPFHYDQEDEPESPTLGMPHNDDSPTLSKISRVNPELTGMSKDLPRDKKTRTYFKLAKSMQLRGKASKYTEAIEDLMKNSQFERKKDLTNLNKNTHHENYIKRPIL